MNYIFLYFFSNYSVQRLFICNKQFKNKAEMEKVGEIAAKEQI